MTSGCGGLLNDCIISQPASFISTFRPTRYDLGMIFIDFCFLLGTYGWRFQIFQPASPVFFFFRTPKLSSSCHGGFQWFSSSRHLRQFWTQYRQVIHSHGCLGPKSALLVIHQVEKMEVGNGWYMMVDLYGIYICMVNKWIIYQYIKQCIYIYTGWWFQTWLLFSIIGNFIIPSDEVPHFSE